MPKGDNELDCNWYAFFVRSGQEEKASEEIKAHFLNEVQTQILSTEILFKRHGIVKKEKQVAFPGYVFVSSRLDNEMFIIQSRNLTSNSTVIYKVLRYGDSGQAILHGKDTQLLEKLWSGRECLEISVGVMEGDKVKIVEGPLVGKESMIKKINKHKRQAVVEINFMGENRLITIGLDIIRKDENE